MTNDYGIDIKPSVKIQDIESSNNISENSANLNLNSDIYSPTSLDKNQKFWRKGKWIEEEENYSMALITAFNDGILDIPEGITLRSFLSDRIQW